MLERTFTGSSEMARRMRELDWSKTSLGPVDRWPSPLRTSVGICLDCAFPIVLWWGPALAILYNDEYRAMLGAKHPAALGQPGIEVWTEIWDVIGPMLSHVIETGEATRSRDLLLHIARQGYQEEAYFSFSYSPIYDESAKVAGIFCPVIETTEKVIGERRLRTLRDLAHHCKGAETEDTAYRAAASVLAANLHDVPFSMIYRIDEDRSTARLASTAGIEAGDVGAPHSVALGADDVATWPLRAVADSGTSALIRDLGARFHALPTGAWKTAPSSALLLPVLLPGQERARAVLIAAVSPMRALDQDYRTFFGLISTQIASGLADAQALQEERRRAEALAEIDRAKTTFFSNVSHEFRTPLTLMIGPLEETLANAQGALSDETATALSVAHRNSLRLLKLVNTLLDFSRIEAGRIDASYEPTDLAVYTAELASVFRSAIEKAGLRLTVDCPALPEPVHVDRDMWEKIVLNLLSNALKFTFEGEIAVVLRWTGGSVELAVSDTGVGIPASDLPKMFQRFHRVKNARSRTHEGTGIGLALVQELARLHGGTTSVHSTEGAGTTFTVTIATGTAHLPQERIGAPRTLASTGLRATPFVEEAVRWLPGDVEQTHSGRGETVAEISLSALTAAETGDAPPARVLVADDNADMRDYLRHLLAQVYDVEAVADGQAALERIRSHVPDVVLTDVMMPRLDGFGLLAALRADERTRSVPVIMLSARAGEESRIEGLHAGADAYLTKPFSARELLARVSSLLELARLRREAELALRHRSEQYETLLHRAPLGVYLVDADFRIREVNPIALPVFGDIPGGVVGRDFGEIIRILWDKEYADELVRLFRHTLATGEPYIMPEGTRRRIDRGVVEYYEWRIDRITLPDGEHGVVCYFRDISVQVRARKAIEDSREALREADRHKNEFLATLAHELRNPLAAIHNSLHVLRLGATTGDIATRLHEMLDRQVNHLVRLVDDLMDVSRITRGKIELRREDVDIAAIVESAVETAKPLIDHGGHRLTVSLPEEPLFVHGDTVRLAQIVANLLNNAAKYTPDGGDIRLGVRRDAGSAVLSVRDSGVGIPAQDLSKVFDLFMQVGRSYSRSQGGLGIGLTLVRDLIQMHGGTVIARSDGEGTGSEFIVTLPALAGTRVTTPRHEQPDSSLPAVIGRRVLVVEDNPDAADSLRMLLTLLGADVHTANDGPTALQAFQSYRPSVAFLDIGMPGMDGYEVARQVRDQPCGRGVTLIALTGWGQQEDRQRSKDAGIDYHLVKPVAFGALEQLLGNLRSTMD